MGNTLLQVILQVCVCVAVGNQINLESLSKVSVQNCEVKTEDKNCFMET